MPGRVEPTVAPLELPKEYGVTTTRLSWSSVSARLEAAARYWLCTVRPDGRPHAVPVDGLWVNDGLWFGGSDTSVHQLNLSSNPRVVVHLEDAVAPIIVEGVAATIVPDRAGADALRKQSQAKYGYAPSADAYLTGVWCVPALRVLAWSDFPRDATRFAFESSE